MGCGNSDNTQAVQPIKLPPRNIPAEEKNELKDMCKELLEMKKSKIGKNSEIEID